MYSITTQQQEWVRKTCTELELRARGAFQAAFWDYQDVLKGMKDLESPGTFQYLQAIGEKFLVRQAIYHDIAAITKLSKTRLPEHFTPELLALGKQQAQAVLEAQFGPRTPDMGLPPELADWPVPVESTMRVLHPAQQHIIDTLEAAVKRGELSYAGNY